MEKKDLNNRLLQAASASNIDTARQAIKDGAEVQSRDSKGRTGLHLAAMQFEQYYNPQGRELIALFLNRGVGINTKDADGATILHYVAQGDQNYNIAEKISEWLSFGADLEARDKDGRGPLHWAVQRGHKYCVKGLIDLRADVNAADETGVTPLHLAARRGDQEIIAKLLTSGAKLEARTRDGKSVWDFAIEGKQDYQGQYLKAMAASLQREREAAAERARSAATEKQPPQKPPEKPKDPWALLAPATVACTAASEQIGYRFTDVFNFSARTYTQIAHNLATKADAVTLKSFDDFNDKTAFEQAFKELTRLGGMAEHAAIAGAVVEKPRKPVKLTLPEAGPEN